VKVQFKKFIIYYLFFTSILPLLLYFWGIPNYFGFGFVPQKTLLLTEFELNNDSWHFFINSFISYCLYVLAFFGPIYLLSPQKISKRIISIKCDNIWVFPLIIWFFHLLIGPIGFISNFIYLQFFVIISIMYKRISTKKALFIFVIFILDTITKFGINSRGSFLFIFGLGFVYFYKTELNKKFIFFLSLLIPLFFMVSLNKYSMEVSFDNLLRVLELIITRFNRIVFWMIPNNILNSNIFKTNNIIDFSFSPSLSEQAGSYYNDLFSAYSGIKTYDNNSAMNSDYLYEIFHSSKSSIFINLFLIYSTIRLFMVWTHVISKKFILYYLFYYLMFSETILGLAQNIFKNLLFINFLFAIIHFFVFFKKSSFNS